MTPAALERGRARALEFVDQDRVHRELYRDPDVFAAEMEFVFKRTWVYVGHESEFPSPGDYKTTRIGTDPVIVSRDRDGDLHVLVNRCRHRAATVCQLEAGNATSFRCQYHGWTYNCAGELVGLPFPEGYEHLDRDDLGLTHLPRIDSYRGLVFASFDPSVPPLTEHLRSVTPYLDRFLDHMPDHELVVAPQAHRLSYQGNWKLQLENGVDGYHANFTHQSFFAVMQRATGKQSRYISSSMEATSAGLGNGHAVLDQSQVVAEVLRRRLETLPGAPPADGDIDSYFGFEGAGAMFDATAGPGFNVAVFPNLQLIGIQLRQIVPVSPGVTEVTIRPMIGRDAPEEINRLRLRYHELFYGPAGFGQPDDLEMFDRVTRGLDSATNDWLSLDRGSDRETVDQRGIRHGHITDETPQREQYRAYRNLMNLSVQASAT